MFFLGACCRVGVLGKSYVKFSLFFEVKLSCLCIDGARCCCRKKEGGRNS